MKQKLAELQERIRRAQRLDDIEAWHVLSLLNELVDTLIYGMLEEADSEG